MREGSFIYHHKIWWFLYFGNQKLVAMHILFILSFILTVCTSMFIGQAMSGGYTPIASLAAAILYIIALFMPFLSEYNILHRGFSTIGDNFKDMMHTNERVKGDVEIILPGEAQAPAEKYIEQKTPTFVGIIFFLIIASALFSYDLVDFYLLGDGLKVDKGPISNF